MITKILDSYFSKKLKYELECFINSNWDIDYEIKIEKIPNLKRIKEINIYIKKRKYKDHYNIISIYCRHSLVYLIDLDKNKEYWKKKIGDYLENVR